MTEEDIKLTASNHLLDNLKILYKQNLFQDVNISCSDGNLWTNGIILSNLNQFWHNTLQSESAPGEYHILLPDESVQTVSDFITYALEQCWEYPTIAPTLPADIVKVENEVIDSIENNILDTNLQGDYDLNDIHREDYDSKPIIKNDADDEFIPNDNSWDRVYKKEEDILDEYFNSVDEDSDEDYVAPKRKRKKKQKQKVTKSKKVKTVKTESKPPKKQTTMKTYKGNIRKLSEYNLKMNGSNENKEYIAAVDVKQGKCRILLEKGDTNIDRLHCAFHYICAALCFDIFQLYSAHKRFKKDKRVDELTEWPFSASLTREEAQNIQGNVRRVLIKAGKLPKVPDAPEEVQNCLQYVTVFENFITSYTVKLSSDFKPCCYEEGRTLNILSSKKDIQPLSTENYEIRANHAIGILTENSEENFFWYEEYFPRLLSNEIKEPHSDDMKGRFTNLFHLLHQWFSMDTLVRAFLHCPFVERKVDIEKHSVRNNYTESIKKMDQEICDICKEGVGFQIFKNASKKNAIANHKEKVHFICGECEAQCDNQKDLLEHKRAIHQGLEFKECHYEGCNFKYQLDRLLQSHITNVHSENRITCANCPRTFPTQPQFNSHLKQCGKYEKCHVCGKIFKSFLLQAHIKEMHTKEKELCPHCAKPWRNLKQHILASHTPDNEKPYQCDYCGKGFIQKNAIKQHMLTHTNERPFQCDYCEQRYNDKSMVRQHERAKHRVEWEHKEMKKKMEKDAKLNRLLQMSKNDINS